MLKVAICDDNPTLTEKINTMLFNYNPNIFETYTYHNPLKLVNQLDQENFDFFILDIEMSEMSGIDLAKKIRERDILSPIVFLTSYKEYMEEVFQVQTFDYLLKPPTEDRLHQVLEKLRQQLEKKEITLYFLVTKLLIKYQPKISFISKKIKDKY